MMLIADTPNKPHLTDMTVNMIFLIEVRIYIYFSFFKKCFYISLRICILFYSHTILLFFYFAALHIFLGTFPTLMKFLDFLIRHLAQGTMSTTTRMSRHILLERGGLPQDPLAPTILM
jgi:hypothetical protein